MGVMATTPSPILTTRRCVLCEDEPGNRLGLTRIVETRLDERDYGKGHVVKARS